MKNLLKNCIAAMPLTARMGAVRAVSAINLDKILPVPASVHAVASRPFQEWIAKYIRAETPFFGDRYAMYRYLHDRLGAGGLAYYEFGVHEGRSLRFWADLNRHSSSRFFGFDSFEGLPEDWDPKNPKGTFDLKGKIPVFDDKRVQLVKGWFDQTLPGSRSLFETSAPKVVHMDADLYSSTMTIFENIGPQLDQRSIVIFDEFYDIDHEFKALADYGRPYEVLAATPFFVQVAIRFI